jgi:hypothetical protein
MGRKRVEVQGTTDTLYLLVDDLWESYCWTKSRNLLPILFRHVEEQNDLEEWEKEMEPQLEKEEEEDHRHHA